VETHCKTLLWHCVFLANEGLSALRSAFPGELVQTCAACLYTHSAPRISSRGTDLGRSIDTLGKASVLIIRLKPKLGGTGSQQKLKPVAAPACSGLA